MARVRRAATPAARPYLQPRTHLHARFKLLAADLENDVPADRARVRYLFAMAIAPQRDIKLRCPSSRFACGSSFSASRMSELGRPLDASRVVWDKGNIQLEMQFTIRRLRQDSMKLIVLCRKPTLSAPPRKAHSRARWAWAAFALMLFSLLGTACSARMLPFEQIVGIFVEDEWLNPTDGSGGAQTGPDANSPPPLLDSAPAGDNTGEGIASESTPTPELETEEFTATPDPNGEFTATPTPVDAGAESPSPTETPTSTPTRTPTVGIGTPTATVQPTQTATSSPPTATPTAILPTATPTSQSATATPTSAQPTAIPAACSYSSNASVEITLVALINQQRANQGIAAMTTSSQLTAAGRQHSRDMACNNFFSHTGSDGSSPFQRMASSGFSFTAAAENIYAGGGSAQLAFNAWMNSPGHRTNMLNPTYTHIGVGYIYCASSTYGSYFTADFARP